MAKGIEMRMTIFGGTGPTGVELIRRALDKDIEVVVYARNPQKITFTDTKLEVVEGPLRDVKAIEQAISGSDVVVSLLGVGISTKGTEISDGIAAIIMAMGKEDVRRLIQISTPTVVDPKDGGDFFLTAMAKLLKLTNKEVYRELIAYSNAVRLSDLDWTLVRVPFLKDDDPGRRTYVGYKGDRGSSHRLSRKNLAKFILDIAENRKYIQQSPYVSD